jgi:hypothetical protein
MEGLGKGGGKGGLRIYKRSPQGLPRTSKLEIKITNPKDKGK